RGHKPREAGPRINAWAVFLAHFKLRISVNDFEFEAEFFSHLINPFYFQVRRTNDQYTTCSVTMNKLLRNQACFDGFTQTNIVCQQETNPWHIGRADNRGQLVLLHLHATTERRL